MSNTYISPNLKKTSVRLDGKGNVLSKKTTGSTEPEKTKEEQIKELEEQLKKLKQ